MEFGIFHEFWSTRSVSQPAAFAESFEQIAAAEEWGLDAVWLAEIHMNPTRSLVSAPLTVASAIAARTSRIKIGTAVQILPLGHPLRLAEETATIDQISGGRVIFGVGRSAFPRAYNAYGISYDESQDRFAESLDIIRKAWTEPVASYQGRYHSFENFTLVPRPVQQPHPEIRIAASQHDTYAAIGGRRHPPFSAVASPPPMPRSGGSPIRCSRRCAPAPWANWRSTRGPIARPGPRPGIRGGRGFTCRCRSMSPKAGIARWTRP